MLEPAQNASAVNRVQRRTELLSQLLVVVDVVVVTLQRHSLKPDFCMHSKYLKYYPVH